MSSQGTSATFPRVAVDALGGDHGPGIVIAGAVRAVRAFGVRVLLVGPKALVESQLAGMAAGGLGIEIVDAPNHVEMAEKVSRATLKKRSSILVGTELLREGRADAFFSAGNTAACWTIGRMVLGTLEGVDRPALTAVVPNGRGRSVWLDVGANASCKARNLEEFAVMGSAFSRGVLHVPEPRVGLMSMGEEETKGNELTKEVHEALKASSLNFVGNVEGHELFSGKVDVVVMDGFTGNVALKGSETLAEMMVDLLREEILSSPLRRLGAWLARGAFRAVRRRTDARQYGGVPLLGLGGCCVIGHGRSDQTAVMHGIRSAAEFFGSRVNASIEEELRDMRARGVAAVAL